MNGKVKDFPDYLWQKVGKSLKNSVLCNRILNF